MLMDSFSVVFSSNWIVAESQAASAVAAVVADRCVRTSTDLLFAAVHGVAVATPRHLQVGWTSFDAVIDWRRGAALELLTLLIQNGPQGVCRSACVPTVI